MEKTTTATMIGDNVALRREVKQLRQANARLVDSLARLKDAEALLLEGERLRTLERVTGSMMHDFNNALMPVLGYADLLLQKPELLSQPMEVTKALDEIRAAALRAAAGIRRLHICTEVDGFDDSGPVDLADLIREVAAARQPGRNGAPPIQVVLDIDPLPPVAGSRTELAEALRALIENASEAMAGGGQLGLTGRVTDGHIDLWVTDTGHGMPPARVAVCRDAFFTTKGSHAAGIGLTLAATVARRHGGSMDVQSCEGDGTTVHIRIPVAPDNRPKTLPPVRSGGRRILIIDDDATTRRLLERYFQGRQMAVVTASSGPDGVHAFEQGAFDLVLTDRVMPGFDGIETARRIHARDADVPIWLLTGLAGDVDGEVLTSGCIRRVIQKPVALSELEAIITAPAGDAT